MPDLHLSKSELFWYGALHMRFRPLWVADDDSEPQSQRVEEVFPIARELWPQTIEPFATLEQLAIEFGIARRCELEPAGTDADNPANPDYDGSPPDDTEWSLADGTAVSAEELDEIKELISLARDEAVACTLSGDEFGTDAKERAFRHPSMWLQLMTGMSVRVPRSVRERHVTQILNSMGSLVAQGHSPSEPGYFYRVPWEGGLHRYRVPQQTSPLYAGLVARFADDLRPPRLAVLSLIAELNRMGVDADTLAKSTACFSDSDRQSTKGSRKPNRLATWVHEAGCSHEQTPEWNAAGYLAAATWAARLLERYAIRSQDAFAAAVSAHAPSPHLPSRDRIDALCEGLRSWVDSRVVADEAQGIAPDQVTPDEMPLLNARFLCIEANHSLQIAARWIEDMGLKELETSVQNAIALSGRLDALICGIPSGLSAAEDVIATSRQLVESVSDSMKLGYGQLYFRELAEGQVYVDPKSQAAILRQPRAIREQIAEAISQYERQTLPNLTVTSACGLIEPVARALAAKWLPAGTYGGDTAGVLKALLDRLRQQNAELRAEADQSGQPHPEAARNLEQLYCTNLAFALHSIGNSVRHYPDKVLKRHDAGVMLHGLCSLLHRIGG